LRLAAAGRWTLGDWIASDDFEMPGGAAQLRQGRGHGQVLQSAEQIDEEDVLERVGRNGPRFQPCQVDLVLGETLQAIEERAGVVGNRERDARLLSSGGLAGAAAAEGDEP